MMATMHFRHEIAYDASPDEVYEMLADPAFRERVSTALDVVSADVAIDRRDDGFSLVHDQVQRTDGLPSFARTFAGETTRAIQVEEWPDRNGGSLRLDSPGKPTTVKGTIALVAEGDTTSEVVELDIRVKVPVLGGKLEKLLADEVRRGMETEHQVGKAWLKGDI